MANASNRQEVWILAGRLNDDGLPVPFCPLIASVFITRTLPTFFRLLRADTLLPLVECVKAIDGFYYVDVAGAQSLLGGEVSIETLASIVRGDRVQPWGQLFQDMPLRRKVMLLRLLLRVVYYSFWASWAGNQVIAAFREHIELQKKHNQSLRSVSEIGGELVRMMRFDQRIAHEMLKLNLCCGFDMFYHFLTIILWRWCEDADGVLVHSLLSDLPDMKSRETSDKLAELATSILAEPEATRSLLDGSPAEFDAFVRSSSCSQELRMHIRRFLEAYGHRGLRESDLINPRWAEEPVQVYTLLASYVASRSQAPTARGDSLGGRPDTAGVLDIVLSSFDSSLWRRVVLKPVFAQLVRLAQHLAALRDNSRFYLLEYSFLMRKLLLDLGTQLERMGCLDDHEDIFFLEFAELEGISQPGPTEHDWTTLLARVAARKRKHYQVSEHPPPEKVEDADQSNILRKEDVKRVADERQSASVLTGRVASPGLAVGTAIVVKDPLDNSWAARADHDTIIVATHGNRDWVYLFPIIKGLVLERGGVLSHVSILAIEFGVPLVLGVTNATLKIPDGIRLIIDGYAGTVTLLSNDSNAHNGSSA